MTATRDADIVPLERSLQWQIRVCEKAKAPVSAMVLGAVGDVLGAQGSAAALGVAEHVRFGDFVPLRILAALHALALDRRAPLLAMLLPTAGGSGAAEAGVIRAAVEQAIEADVQTIAEYVSRTPQTNEVGRAHPLRLALSAVGRRFSGFPIQLHELGSSGGLLLNADRLEPMPGEATAVIPRITARVGYDTSPLDVSTVEDRLRLSSYIWPDHVDRFRRLGAAITVAQRHPVELRPVDALSAVRSMDVSRGSATFIWHSALVPYLADGERIGLRAEFERLGVSASADAPFALASWEVDSHAQARRLDFTAALTIWAGGEPEILVLATGNSHATEVSVTTA